MKKFLFTLAALLMVSTAFAEDYLYMEDFTITQEQLGTNNQRFDVKAHFDSYVSALQMNFACPEGLTVRTYRAGADYPITGWYDDLGDPVTSSPALQFLADYIDNIIVASMDAACDADGNQLGVQHWQPGDYAQFFQIIFIIDENFQGGDLVITTEPSAGGLEGYDNICPKGQVNKHTCHISVEGAQPPVQTPAPEIVVTEGENAYIFTATGEGEVKLFVDGVEVENPYTVERTDVAQIIKLTATAHVEGQTDGSVYGEYLVPALEVVAPVDLTGEVVISDPDENGVVTITYTGEEEGVTITVTVNGEEVALGEDGTITVGEGESTIVVTVTGEGYNDLTSEKVVTYVAPVVPQPTATPEITYVVNEDNVVITATGEGEVILMVNGEAVENPYTIERGATDVVVVVTATAQAEGQLISDVATMEITIPAVGGVEPQDPHATGVWAVFFDKNGNEVWYEMTPGYGEPTPYGADLPLNKGVYGFPVDGVEPLVDFYLVIDGVNYGPEAYEELTEPEQFGDANMHQLYAGDEHFAVPSGYWYSIGVITDRHTGIKYLQISKGVFTSIEEMNAGKTVAGVRYFNLAGQEMQEANGMTIVVTTYTDGTTSAVKVMK
jgi:hypothetical protein